MSHSPARPAHQGRLRAAAPALAIAALMALYVAGYAWSGPHTDSADELMRGYEIRHGLAFPLQGPPLGQVLHLGPAWFYLMAVPLWLHESWLCGALFVGFVASLKFPFAYACGKRLLDARFGMLWAVALLVPGWSSLEQLVFLNPNAVTAAILGVLALGLRAMGRPSLAGFAALGLALAIAAHVHPNAAPVALVVLPVALRWRRAGGSLLAAAACFSIAFAIPFAPYAYYQVTSAYPDFQAASAYVRGEVTLGGMRNAPSIAWHFLATGPALVAEYLGRWSSRSALALGIAMALLHAVAAAAALSDPRLPVRRVALGGLVAVALFAAWIGAMRITTPFQFTWALEAPMASVLAIGLHSISRWQRMGWAVSAVAVAIVMGDAAVLRAMAIRVTDGEGRLPSTVLDIKGALPEQHYVGGWFPAWAHGELGRLLCRAPRPLALHGTLGYLVDKDIGLDGLLACGSRDAMSLGGTAANARHWTGMSAPFWRALGREPDCVVGGLGITSRVTPVAPAAALQIAAGDTYLPRRPSGGAPAGRVYTFDAAPHEGVLVTNLLRGYEEFAGVAADVDGISIAPAASNDFAALFVAPAGGSVRHWTVRAMASQPAGVDLVLLDRTPGPHAGCEALLRP